MLFLPSLHYIALRGIFCLAMPLRRFQLPPRDHQERPQSTSIPRSLLCLCSPWCNRSVAQSAWVMPPQHLSSGCKYGLRRCPLPRQHHICHRARFHAVKHAWLLQGSTAAATRTTPRHPWPCYQVESSPNLSLRHLAHTEDQVGEFWLFRKDLSTSCPHHSNCWQHGEVLHWCSPL